MPRPLFFLSWLTLLSVAESAPPNIVIVFSDDHALQAIGAYGSRLCDTPNIDRVASEGIVFENSFCTNSVCGPSRASVLTGKHSHANGMYRNGNRFDATQTTFVSLLREAGYQTALIGKWHLWCRPEGFDHWEVLPGQGSYYNPDFRRMDGSLHRRTGYVTDVVTDLTINWLEEQRDPERPFVLMCHHKAPHRNWSPALRHLSLYADDEFTEPATLRDDYRGRSRLLADNEMSIREHFDWGWDMKFHGPCEHPEHFRDQRRNEEYERMTPEQQAAWDAHFEPRNAAFLERLESGDLDAEEVLSWKYQRYVRNYLRCVAAVDESVGRLLECLDAEELSDNTLFVYSSDQGFYLGEHGWYEKRWIYEQSLRMPLIARLPGRIAPGTRAKAMVQNIDYAPTFLELAGIEAPEDLHGESLVPLFTGETPDGWRDEIYYAFYEDNAVHNAPKHDGVRTKRHKLFYLPKTDEWQLIDLLSDPDELDSVHADPLYSAVLKGMMDRYRRLKACYGTASIGGSTR